MKNIQLFDALKSLSKNEFREFGKFVYSPYFNNRSEVARLYDAIKKYYPGFTAEKIDVKRIFEKIYPGKSYNDVLMRKVFSLALNLVMDFFAVSSFRENSLEYSVKIADKLREKKLAGMFEKKVKSIESLLDTMPHTFSFYETKFNFATVKNGYYLHTDENLMVRGFQKEIDNFIEYFLAVILLLYIRSQEWSKAYNIKFDLKFYDEVINFLKKYDYNNIPLVGLYYNMLMVLTAEDDIFFYKLLECQKKFAKKLHFMDDYNVSVTLMQYCYKKVQKGESSFRKQQFEIVNSILDKNMLPPGDIEPYFFINTIRNAACLNEFEWCYGFIKKYKSRLNTTIVNDILGYSNALIAFYQKNFEQALNSISKINIDRSTIKTEFRNIQIVIYYELKYFDELVSLIDSYRHFLARDNGITEKMKESGNQFIKLVSRLLKLNFKNEVITASLLKEEVNNQPYFNFKEWILLKLEQFMQK